jgi:hypothetical protein
MLTEARSLVRGPILTAGPMQQKGPISTVSSSTAVGWTTALGCIFKLGDRDVGTILSNCSLKDPLKSKKIPV